MTTIRTTTDFEQGRFRQHGRASVSFDGRIMRFESTGPFNAEHIKAAERTIRDLLREDPPHGPYFDVIRLHGSALIAMDVLPALEKLVENLLSDGLLSSATAIVDEEGVEGFKLMYPPYAAIYAAHGHPVRSFTSYAEAEAWLATLLAAAGA